MPIVRQKVVRCDGLVISNANPSYPTPIHDNTNIHSNRHTCTRFVVQAKQKRYWSSICLYLLVNEIPTTDEETRAFMMTWYI